MQINMVMNMIDSYQQNNTWILRSLFFIRILLTDALTKFVSGPFLAKFLWEKKNLIYWQLFLFSIKVVLKYFQNSSLINELKTPINWIIFNNWPLKKFIDNFLIIIRKLGAMFPPFTWEVESKVLLRSPPLMWEDGTILPEYANIIPSCGSMMNKSKFYWAFWHGL